jgi:hypothetical protein
MARRGRNVWWVRRKIKRGSDVLKLCCDWRNHKEPIGFGSSLKAQIQVDQSAKCVYSKVRNYHVCRTCRKHSEPRVLILSNRIRNLVLMQEAVDLCITGWVNASRVLVDLLQVTTSCRLSVSTDSQLHGHCLSFRLIALYLLYCLHF